MTKYMGLSNLKTLDQRLMIELVYATADNFTNTTIYPDYAKAYLVTPAATALMKANTAFNAHGLYIKIWDAYRPFSMQEKLWAAFPNSHYVAEPIRKGTQLVDGSMHSRGAAIDMTLMSLSTGQETAMPTAFDEFSEKAHRNYQNLPKTVLQNRQLMETIMAQHGFVGHPNEWWHFDWQHAMDFELLDIDFANL